MSSRLRKQVQDMHDQNQRLLDLPTELTWDNIYSESDLVDEIEEECGMTFSEQKETDSESQHSIDFIPSTVHHRQASRSSFPESKVSRCRCSSDTGSPFIPRPKTPIRSQSYAIKESLCKECSADLR